MPRTLSRFVSFYLLHCFLVSLKIKIKKTGILQEDSLFWDMTPSLWMIDCPCPSATTHWTPHYSNNCNCWFIWIWASFSQQRKKALWKYLETESWRDICQQLTSTLFPVTSVCAYLFQQSGGSERQDAPLSTFTVAPGKRYRFRLAYAGGGRACPITVSIANHVLRVISLDGNPIIPREVTSFVMAAGQQIYVNPGLATWRLRAGTMSFA